MNKLWISLLIVTMLFTAGCPKNGGTTIPTAAPTGSLNTFDATTNETLQAIHAFVASMVAQNNSGAITLTISQKALLNQLVTDVNTADVIYQAWHNAGGTGATAPVSTAINKAQADQNALNTAIAGGK